MTARSLLAAGAAAGALFALATTAGAQPAARPATAPGAPAAGSVQVNSGPPITGVCIFTEPAALTQSTVGQAVRARLQQLVTQVNAELGPELTSLQADGRAFDARRGTMDEATMQKTAADLNLRAQNLQKLRDQRNQELDLTERKQLARIHAEVVPVLATVYQQRNCSLLLDGQAVLLGNPAMDLTSAVISGLNAKVQTLAFDREPLPAQTAAPAPQ
ncbi:MAG: OmpH family outer membrane protein [Caulobacterales bacterium]